MPKKIRKHIMLNLDDEFYFKIKKEADRMHLPISTWVKLQLINVINQEGK